jgi:hypothetical protein
MADLSLAVGLALCVFLLSGGGGGAAAVSARYTHLQASSRGSNISKEMMMTRRNLLANGLGKTPPMG